MYHNDRKSFILPCGRSVGESWAAIRKAWLGFKIAFSNDDTALMTHYASFITKVQTEMGIRVTNFDPAILNEQAIDEISRSCFYKKQPETRVRLEEKSLDYDLVMEKARTFTNTKSLNISPPRQNIFNRPKNSCWYSPQEKKDYSRQKIVTQTRNTEKSCMWSSDKTPMSNGEEKSPSCYYKAPNSGEGQSQDKLDGWDANEVDPCYCEVPSSEYEYESQSQAEDENWETEDDETKGEKEVVVGVDPCYYLAPGNGNEPQSQEVIDFQDDISTEDNEVGRESSRRRSCFYKSNGWMP
jgi:hypothetical protein